jgi:myo-inositol-1(or 4)-monophosphatase
MSISLAEIHGIMLQLLPEVKKTGDSILSGRSTALMESGKDIKIDMDRILNEKLTSVLKKFLDIEVLSEEDESALELRADGALRWVLDPLDGSLNHLRNIPLSCISIALWAGMEPLMGIVYDYNRKEIYAGIVGEGASLNGAPIRTGDIAETGKGILCTGFPSYRDYGDKSLLEFAAFVQKWKKVRLLGSAALSLAYVAAGRADGYLEEDIRIWDVAAGLALVKSAGGEISCKPGKKPNFVTAAATNGKISVRELVN